MSGDIVKGLFENMDDDTKRRFEEHVAAQVEQNLREQGELPSPNTPGAMNFTPDDQAAPFRHVSKPDQDGYMDYLPPDPAFVDEPVTTVDWPKLEALFVNGRHVEPSDVDWEECDRYLYEEASGVLLRLDRQIETGPCKTTPSAPGP